MLLGPDLPLLPAPCPPFQDRAQKLRVLEVYNLRLDQREQRRQLALQHGLLNAKRLGALDRRRNTQDREFHARMRVFARYSPSLAQHDELVEGLLLERKLRQRIGEVQEYRRAELRR